MEFMEHLKRRRDKLQQQLDQWISRGFRGGGKSPSDDATPKETAKKVSEVAKAAVGGDIIVLGNVTVPTGAIAMIGLTVATTVGVELARYR